jgi:hypothetical protein
LNIVTKVEKDDPQLLDLARRFVEKTTNWAAPEGMPEWWLGVKEDGKLRSTIGMTPVVAGLRIDYLFFDGTVPGFRRMVALADHVNQAFKNVDLYFRTTADNRVMRRLFEGRYGATEAVIGYRVAR